MSTSDEFGDMEAGFPGPPEDSQSNVENAERWSIVRRFVTSLDRILLGGPRRHTRRSLASSGGLSTMSARKFWRSMGFPNLDDDVMAFTDADRDAMQAMARLVRDGLITEDTAMTLTRGFGHHMGRLALWQIEALVEDEMAVRGVSDAEARMAVLSRLPAVIEVLELEAIYAWRRQLDFVAARMGAEILQSSGLEETNHSLPLARSVGFADLVSYTRLAQRMEGHELADLVQTFEQRTRDIVTIGGGRVVKTVGDEILYVADTPEDGAQISMSISEHMSREQNMPEVRVGLVWGKVLSRLGDVFGPPVNLAARLEVMAHPGNVIVDRSTADAIEVNWPGAFVAESLGMQNIRGMGEVEAMRLRRGNSQAIVLD